MTTVVVLPPAPRSVRALAVDPGRIREYAADLLAASTQADEAGSYAAAAARIDEWTGLGSTAYDSGIRATGQRADAMSLALRAVARRVDQHADTMQTLLDRRTSLVEERAHLSARIADLRGRVGVASLEEADAIRAECDDCAGAVRAYESDVDTWATDVIAEEEAMREAFVRMLTIDQVEHQYGGATDPAEATLASMPGVDASPSAVNRWWDGLTQAQQLALIAAAPGVIGNRDGIPASARDAANTVALGRDLAAWGYLEQEGLITDDERQWLANARAAQDAIDVIEAGVDPQTGAGVSSQLYLYDPSAFDGDGAIAISAGDLDHANHVAVTVPGFGTDAESAAYLGDRALTIYESTRFLGQDSVASMFWIGYDAPDNLPWTGEGWDAAGVLGESMATAGGDRLADAIDGLRASRDGDPAHLTVIGHSYGSTTLGHAAYDHGVAVDDLVFVGSPGVGGETDEVNDLHVDPDHVWAGSNSRDPVADLGNHGWFNLESALGGAGLGDDPAADDFGAIRFEAESTTRPDRLDFDQHSRYFDPDSESLYNLSQIVDGNYDAVIEAAPISDPWYAGPQDPEWGRTPGAPHTGP
jgi:pimeloyl-ACP methyl ester carboxylesterase/uncharacterized protein YukE